MKKINKNMKIAEVLSINPKTINVFFDFGIGCAGCPMAQMETLEQGAKAHGINPDELVKKLNEAIEE